MCGSAAGTASASVIFMSIFKATNSRMSKLITLALILILNELHYFIT